MPDLNESIRRARPTIDSSLARWIKGESDDATAHPLAQRRVK